MIFHCYHFLSCASFLIRIANAALWGDWLGRESAGVEIRKLTNLSPKEEVVPLSSIFQCSPEENWFSGQASPVRYMASLVPCHSTPGEYLSLSHCVYRKAGARVRFLTVSYTSLSQAGHRRYLKLSSSSLWEGGTALWMPRCSAVPLASTQ